MHRAPFIRSLSIRRSLPLLGAALLTVSSTMAQDAAPTRPAPTAPAATPPAATRPESAPAARPAAPAAGTVTPAQNPAARPTAPAAPAAVDRDEVLRRMAATETQHRERMAKIQRLRELASQGALAGRGDLIDELERKENARFEEQRSRARKLVGDEAFRAADARHAAGRERKRPAAARPEPTRAPAAGERQPARPTQPATAPATAPRQPAPQAQRPPAPPARPTPAPAPAPQPREQSGGRSPRGA
ncbi:MAG: hypothetical protein ACT4PU_05980 [Planctomycetota bacterium]